MINDYVPAVDAMHHLDVARGWSSEHGANNREIESQHIYTN